MLLLALDTSTPTVTAGVALLRRPHELAAASEQGHELPPVQLLAERTVNDPFAHAEQLMPLVQAALDESGHRLDEVEAVVVGLGPGPFTGLRVGIATAQALGDALDIAVHGVGSHDAIARAELSAADPAAGDFLVVTDARRREVYVSAYSGQGRRLFGPAPVAPAAVGSAVAGLADPTRMIGAGTGLLAAAGVELPVAADGPAGLTEGLVLAAGRALLTGVVPGPLTPLYLRRPDATEPGPRRSVLGR